MGRSLRGARALALVGAAALLVAGAGCSDSTVGGPEDQASGGGSGSVEAFCEDYAAVDERFSDPAAQPEPAEVVDALEQIDAPEEIADDWETFTAGFADADEIDVNDPESAGRIAEIQEAASAIQEFRAAECEIDTEEG
jgi:hypothetical protein